MQFGILGPQFFGERLAQPRVFFFELEKICDVVENWSCSRRRRRLLCLTGFRDANAALNATNRLSKQVEPRRS
ncbi:hypothetical protein IB263_32310 [Ensifer sp. ENS03]|nr:hypothetical protein [Ensifer sp. ENS03]